MALDASTTLIEGPTALWAGGRRAGGSGELVTIDVRSAVTTAARLSFLASRRASLSSSAASPQSGPADPPDSDPVVSAATSSVVVVMNGHLFKSIETTAADVGVEELRFNADVKLKGVAQRSRTVMYAAVALPGGAGAAVVRLEQR